ncbi:unnamed protein product [Schistocephalus solidus]|uniref:Rab-GAP TBC domain-containing protein n=1 Tax=Schistocephalus solidus TaxID=70667 RepID=A0A183SE52_SCHSO|nr:unnamed protein product [Schistocephalus solidus]
MQLKPEDVFTGVSKLIIEYQVSLTQLSEEMKQGKFPLTYDSLVGKLDEIIFPLQYSMQLVSCFGVIQDNSVWRLIGCRLLSKVLQAQCENFYSDATIYEALHKILLEMDDPEGSKKGILQQFLAESWACGAGLSTIASRKTDSSPAEPTECASCPLEHFPHTLSARQAQKRLSELQYLRAELTRIEREFERMVASSAFVSLPQTQRTARLTGRYQGSQNIDSQLPDYLTNALSPEAQGQVPVAESDLAASAPPWLFRVLGGRIEGGYVTGMRVNLGIDRTALIFLRHCSNREIRRTVWRALVQRAGTRNFGGASGQHAANDERIQHIRKLRSQVAEQFNAPDWLSLVWHRSTPGGRGPESPEKLVKEVLEPLRKKLLPLGKLEWVVLSEWAPPYLRLPPNLEHFDIDYAVEQYNYITSVTPGSSLLTDPRHERRMPLQATVDNIFTRLGDLFGLTVRRLPAGEGHAAAFGLPDGTIYEILRPESGGSEKAGEIIVNICAKPWVSNSVEAITPVPLVTAYPSHLNSQAPACAKFSVAGLFGSLPSEAAVAGLSEMEALSVAAGFGTCLQHVISRTPCHMFTGLSTPLPGVTFAGSTRGSPVRDNCFLTHDLLQLLLLRSASLRRSVFGEGHSMADPQQSSSWRSGAANVIAGTRGISRMVALPLLRSLYESRFDLELWSASSKNRHWQTISDQLWVQHLPYSRHPYDQWPCSALGIFGSQGIPGSRYSEIWRQLIAFDCLSAFTEAGFERDYKSEPVQNLLKRYRNTVLTAGTAISCRDVFRAFRGRDPKPDAFIDALLPRTTDTVRSSSPTDATDVLSPGS